LADVAESFRSALGKVEVVLSGGFVFARLDDALQILIEEGGSDGRSLHVGDFALLQSG
jgi:hypothetical protein